MNSDIIHNPKHYTQGDIECIDAIALLTKGLTGEKAYCLGNMIKYIWRCNSKNGEEDLHKAKWYVDRLLKEESGGFN